jgi:GGDEF domain-containing protein
VVILRGVSDRKEASRVAGLLADAVSQPELFGGRELRVGASFGISVCPDDGLTRLSHFEGIFDYFRLRAGLS